MRYQFIIYLTWYVTALGKQCQRRTLVTGHCRVNALPFMSLQIFNEEYAVLYLDQGGALVAIRHTPLPIRHLWWVRAQPFVTCIVSSVVTLVRQKEISLLTKLFKKIYILGYEQQCNTIWGVLSSFCFFTLPVFVFVMNQSKSLWMDKSDPFSSFQSYFYNHCYAYTYFTNFIE